MIVIYRHRTISMLLGGVNDSSTNLIGSFPSPYPPQFFFRKSIAHEFSLQWKWIRCDWIRNYQICITCARKSISTRRNFPLKPKNCRHSLICLNVSYLTHDSGRISNDTFLWMYLWPKCNRSMVRALNTPHRLQEPIALSWVGFIDFDACRDRFIAIWYGVRRMWNEINVLSTRVFAYINNISSKQQYVIQIIIIIS